MKMSETKRDRIWKKSVHPRFLGGKDRDDNLVPVCTWCNKSKKATPLEEWRKKRSLAEGYSFTSLQRAIWGARIPPDEQYLFWFEKEGLQP